MSWSTNIIGNIVKSSYNPKNYEVQIVGAVLTTTPPVPVQTKCLFIFLLNLPCVYVQKGILLHLFHKHGRMALLAKCEADEKTDEQTERHISLLCHGLATKNNLGVNKEEGL